MGEILDIIEGQIEKFDALREVFLPESRALLLSGDGETENFKVRKELAGGWYLKYSEYRGFFRLNYATLENESFRVQLNTSGFVAIVVGGKGEVYQIEDGDTVPPSGAKPYWRIACRLIGGKKFVPTA